MNSTTEQALRTFIAGHPEHESWKVADLGSYNVNGQVRDIIPNVTGYDMLLGPGVDHVIVEAPYIPSEHREQYDLVTCCGVLMIAENPEFIREEAYQLLKPEGWLFLTTCSPECKCHHTTPWGEDKHRLSVNDLILLMRKKFVVNKVWMTEHPEVVYTGRRR